MTRLATKTLERIEDKIKTVEEGSMRYLVLQSAKNFKTSWVELGQALYAVWKEKSYKDWGYITFEAYTAKEVGIRNQTALKLVKSYYFLEKEEPSYLKKDYTGTAEAAKIPSLDSVNILRLAKSKKQLDEADYSRLKKEVFESGRDERDIKKDVVSLVRQRQEPSPAEAREKKRQAVVKRLLATLKALKTELEATKAVSAEIINQTRGLIAKVEAEI